jgi:lipopolysaccharide/colanic/teichoic acid biosynthesis glycosyltransferase
MTLTKRLMDLGLLALFLPFAVPLGLLVAAALLVTEGRPVFYVSERMKAPGQGFRLWKFRTMRADPSDWGVSGGDKAGRITTIGGFLRRSRLDELPQLWNILRGDMTFVGPRPPLRRYVEAFPALYAVVLRGRPGVTGLATLRFHRREAEILARCTTPEETEACYVRLCIPVKARLDILYLRRRSFCLDLQILAKTCAGLLKPR